MSNVNFNSKSLVSSLFGDHNMRHKRHPHHFCRQTDCIVLAKIWNQFQVYSVDFFSGSISWYFGRGAHGINQLWVCSWPSRIFSQGFSEWICTKTHCDFFGSKGYGLSGSVHILCSSLLIPETDFCPSHQGELCVGKFQWPLDVYHFWCRRHVIYL